MTTHPALADRLGATWQAAAHERALVNLDLEWGAIGPSGRVWVPNPTDGAGKPVADLEGFVREFAAGSGMTLVARRPGDRWEPACVCGHARDQHDEQGRCDHGDRQHCPGFLPAARLDEIAAAVQREAEWAHP